MAGNSPGKDAKLRVEVGRSAGNSPHSGDFPVMGDPGFRQARIALASLALLVVAGFAVDIYLVMAARLDAAQLVLVLVIQGVLSMAAIAWIWTRLETRILQPLRMLQDDIDVMAEVSSGMPVSAKARLR